MNIYMNANTPEKTYSAVFYALWGGKFKKLKGIVEIFNVKPNDVKYAKFREELSYNRFSIKSYSVPIEPGLLYNRSLWLSEEEDNKAIDILMEYEKDCISKLNEEIKQHEELLDFLNNQKE